jgi:hypothetical protein
MPAHRKEWRVSLAEPGMNLTEDHRQQGYVPPPQGRSARHRAERRARSGRLARAVLPAFFAIVVVAAVAVLSSPLVPTLMSFAATSPATAVTPSTSGVAAAVSTNTTASPTQAAAAGSALLVIQQDGKPAVLALFYAGPKGGAVLAMPGGTLVRSGDRFVLLAQAFSRSDPATLAQPVAAAFSVPKSAVASVEWGALRTAVAQGSQGASPPDSLDPAGANSDAVATALAAAMGGKALSGGAGGWWQPLTMTGQAEAFRATVAAEAKAAGGAPWTGEALGGQTAEYGDGTSYLEPDIQAARAFLATTGAAAGSSSGN